LRVPNPRKQLGYAAHLSCFSVADRFDTVVIDTYLPGGNPPTTLFKDFHLLLHVPMSQKERTSRTFLPLFQNSWNGLG
jgi:hypothetical protein